MNKDVIYIEPEDDITDIITKIENSKSRIVALVPPKKVGVFRSAVNIKLIAKSANVAKKTVVLVTTDPPIMRLAAATKIPVTKDLQSAPSVPTAENEVDNEVTEEVADPEDEKTEGKEVSEEVAVEKGDEAKDDQKKVVENSDDKDGDDKEAKKGDGKKERAKQKAPKNEFTSWIKQHQTMLLLGGIGGLILIIVLIWALVIVPSVTLTIGIKTDVNNFSEPIKFTNNFNEENADEGVFYLEEKKNENTNKVEFEATGKKNIGEKAKGSLIIYAFFKGKGSVNVSAGTDFSYDGLYFSADEELTLSWDGATAGICENNGQASAITSGCLISGRINVTAIEPGEKYNLAAANTGWNTSADVAVYSDNAMTGGTDDIITIVSEEDITKAKNEIASSDQNENKEKLLSEINDNMMVIESSFAQETADAVSTPAVGEKVEEGKKAVLTVKTTARIYAIDKTKVEEFIKKKAKLAEGQVIYEIRNPFIENFVKTEGVYTGKLKTSFASGPEVTENIVINIVKGKGLGEAQHDLRDISGIVEVHIDPSFPWVTTIPNDPNRITVIIEVKDKSENNLP